MKPETARWMEGAQQDLASAEATLERGLYAPSVFHCQQALEKALKAIWIQKATEGVPPRRHNLIALANDADLQLSEAQRELLSDLSRQYTPSRYPDRAVVYSPDEAVNYLQRTREVLSWLRQLLS